MAKKTNTSTELTYDSAFEELTNIRIALENNEIPIDDLATHMNRAAELVSFCRKKLRSIEADLQTIVDENNKKTNQ